MSVEQLKADGKEAARRLQIGDELDEIKFMVERSSQTYQALMKKVR